MQGYPKVGKHQQSSDRLITVKLFVKSRNIYIDQHARKNHLQ
jgi:hypothetical protein